jgi:hypothetical protein
MHMAPRAAAWVAWEEWTCRRCCYGGRRELRRVVRSKMIVENHYIPEFSSVAPGAMQSQEK